MIIKKILTENNCKCKSTLKTIKNISLENSDICAYKITKLSNYVKFDSIWHFTV